MAIIFMKWTKATLLIISANQGDSSMEDEDLQAKEIKEDSEEVAGFEINEKYTKMISIH